ncbi:helix-turn-helix transcriptional regulator [Salmonella enterica]|nr:helix-turn-helix transcriptional regulator [Salmonella enterica]
MSEHKTTSESTKDITSFWEDVKNLSLATYAPVKASDEDEQIQDMHNKAIETLRNLYFNEINRQAGEEIKQRQKKVNSSTSTIGARIKLAREVLNISKYDLARRIGTSSHNIAGWETGIYEPSLSQIIPLATALKCSVRWLLGEEELDIPGKLIKDRMGVYSAHLGESAKKSCAISRVVNIHIRNDVIGDKFFMPKVADTLIKYATMIKNTTAGRYSNEHFEDDNGNQVTIIGGRLSEEERLPSPALSDYDFISSSKKM